MAFLVRLFIAYLCLVELKCEVYKDRPKIKAVDGDLILEPAYDRNIHIRLNGPQSKLFVGDVNILNMNMTSGTVHNQLNEQVEQVNKIPQELLQRIDRLEATASLLSNNVLFNITFLARRINNLNNRIRTLQNQINNRGNDECQSRPCANGGTCLSLVNGYHCLCPSAWKGRNCDEDVNECRIYAGTDLGCQNGATCINRPGSYECICRPGWFGLDCTRKTKDCSGGDFEMCGHGTCIPVTTGEGVKCFCNQGWTNNETHIACLTDVNECESGQGARCSVNPRVECVNLPGSFKCGQCPHGYEGDGFSCYDIDECLTLPNGGCSTSPMVSCHNTIGSRVCGSCPPGYQGDGVSCTWKGTCSINHGGCHPSAQCVETSALGRQFAQCVCPYGMAGDGIGIHGCYISVPDNSTQTCQNNPCGIHGRCHSLRQGYSCICDQGYRGMHCERFNDFCSINPCLNGGTCRLEENSSKGFRCECTTLYSGNLCQTSLQHCGGVLDAEEGSISYPISNSSYVNNARCAWVIHTVPEKVINVTFSKFNLEHHAQCNYDFVQIHDGRSSASQLIGRFCGNSFPNGGNIISSHNNLYFWFRSDPTVAKSGFALHWTSIPPKCGGELDASTHGHISSPGSPGNYPPNRDCYWHLKTTLGKRIQLHFYQLDIEVHINCSYDYIAIYDGSQTLDPLLSKYCNSTQPPPLESAGSEMLIHFHSDEYASGKGFQISYAPIQGVPGCGGLFTSDKGEIISPSYDGSYLNNLLCEYNIKTRLNTKIRVKFIYFDIERSVRCRYDYLSIYDGASSNSRLIGKFCGKTPPNLFMSSGNNIYIIFKSDHTMASGGFKLQYESVCHNTIYGDSGILKSPGYPLAYPKQTICEYIIGTTPGKVIQLTFQDFDIEDNRYYNCQYDYIEIRDGPTPNSTLIGRFCGGTELTPPTQISSYNYMYLKFNSDLSIQGSGFYANYTTTDIECGGIYRESTGIINHPATTGSYYKNDQSCTWMIIAPPGMFIQLTWNRFELENMSDCVSDYVELIETGNFNNTLGKYCGTSIPPSITATSNIITVKFQSDSSIEELGFSLSYEFLDEKTHCGGVYTKTHGFIYSPGWPEKYTANKDCTWIITVPEGQQVSLNISDFDLEKPIRDTCDLGDHLTVRDGSSQSAPLIGKFCGSFKTKRIISTTRHIFIHFHSDYYLSGTGFKIEFDGNLQGCGGTLASYSGSISSPNYPQNYDENAECFYKIVTSRGSRVQIRFTDLDLEDTSECSDDYVEIFDGQNTNSPRIGKYCHLSTNLTTILTTSNYAFIKFRSDFIFTKKGFFLDYNTVCNNNISGSYGVIESPGYPIKYPLLTNCLWTITVPKGNVVNITFTDFSLFASLRPYSPYRYRFSNSINYRHQRPYNIVNFCEFDYLQFKETTGGNFSDKLCGTNLPHAITSKTNSVQIKFVSGYYYSYKGFRLEWAKYGCGSHIQKRSGSLDFDDVKKSKGEIECEWLLETPSGTSVMMIISDFYIEESKNCTIDAIEIYNGQSIAFPLLTKVCHRGKVTVQATSNLMFVRLVKRSSQRDIYLAAQFQSMDIQCGGVIESQFGIIQSKNYPRNYDNNMDCIWYISVPNNHRIELNFMDLDLYSNDDTQEECNDAVKIYDGNTFLKSNYSYLICPMSNISNFVSQYSSIAIQFSSDNYGTAKGFLANFTMVCGAIIRTQNDGIISNNNYINSKNRNCTWTILAPSLNEHIKLTVQYLNIPRNLDVVTNRNCPSSFLNIYDGDDDQSPIVDEFCGNKVPPMIVSHGNALTIKLGTYTNTFNGQFSAHYSILSSTCGGELTSEEGSIASPNYPLSYPVNIDCEWTLKTSPGNKVYITFETFNLYDSEGCNEDYVEVRENNGGGTLLGVYCGSDVPINTTSASKLFIKFHSNNVNTGQGFLLHYGFIHGNDITGLYSGEIASPLYPYAYQNEGLYTWRITTKGSKSITIDINVLEIPKRSDECDSKLIIYDGYDEEAPILEELCGILKSKYKTIKTSSNVAFIQLLIDKTNMGALFYLKWSEMNREVNLDKSVNCGSNTTLFVSGDHDIVITSPEYPNVYKPNLNCEWILKSEPGRHLTLKFLSLEVEETSACSSDYVSIYSSYSPLQWTPLKENMCLSLNANENIEALTYLKIKFITDHSVNKKGFMAVISSACGGLLTDESGVIENTYNNNRLHHTQLSCDWIIKVRPGRKIKLKFDNFNITNEDICKTYVVVRNGGSNESPLLGDGKYCGYSHENRSEVVSSSNYVFVRYVEVQRYLRLYQNFKLRYEEKNIECGITSILDTDHKWELISSPNYPSIPTPYSECVWKFTAPPGEILRIDFIDRFDLDPTQNCDTESVEVRDGSTRMSPLKGVFCKQRPSTIKTTNNAIFVKYSTQLLEPRNGFRANISLDICGGTIISESGEIESPNYPHMLTLPEGTICEWHIISTPGHTIKITFKDIELPISENMCETKITIEDPIPTETAMGTIKEFCDFVSDGYSDPIETNTNKAVVKLRIGKSTKYAQISERRGFKLSFNSSRSFCGGLITTSEGYISTPGYPRSTSLRFCQWLIVLPNENRRVRLEIEDINVNYQFTAYNDITFTSKIIDTNNVTNSSNSHKVFESTGNKLAFYIWMRPISNKINRFKAKFSSDSPTLCGGNLQGLQGELSSPNISRPYACEWRYTSDASVNNITGSHYNSIYVTLEVTSSNRNICRHTDSAIIIQSQIHTNLFSRKICGNNTHVSFRIPSSSQFKIKANQYTMPLFFVLKWKLQPCGGVINLVSNDPINILNIPDNYNAPIECGWILVSEYSVRFELTLEGTFNLECSDEYITIKQGMSQTSLAMADYCKDKIPDRPLVSSFKYTYIQYHSGSQRRTNVKLFTKTLSVQCGGLLTKLERVFTSPNYPHNYQENQECTWEIQTDLGYRISLQFIDRFVIEYKTNCTKDVVIIYDWKDNTYNEIARLCGRNLPPVLNSTYNQMKVVFRSDSNITLDGFKAQWTPICGGNFIATENYQYLYSPGYSLGYYHPSLNCHYEISALSKKVIITFIIFEIEGPIPDCKFDNLTITAENNYNYIYEIHCGNEKPKPVIAQDNVKLDFKTDRYSQLKGFKISYVVYTCGGKVTNPTTIALDTLSDNTNCTWLIEAPMDKLIVLKFDYINVESSYDCYSDYLAVFEGSYINPDKRLALICGRVNSTYIKSKGNKLTLQIFSDRNFDSRGFKVRVLFSYTESAGCGGEINLTTPNNYILRSPILNNANVYENFMDCHWSIRVPTDHIIKVKFTSFHIAPCFNVNQTAMGFSNCECDYVTLKDGSNPNSLIIGKYCGHDIPPEITSSSSSMSIILSTDGDITSSGFEASLSYVPSTCGQSVYAISKDPQHIMSPGYNRGYIPRGLHCSYHLDSSLEPYSTIYVSVRFLDLESGVRDECDRDKLILYSSTKSHNLTMGKDFIWNADESDLIQYAHIYDSSLRFPKTFILCGQKHSLDFYLLGNTKIHLVTSPEATSTHKGVDIEFSYAGFCSRNYSDPQGRIQNVYGSATNTNIKDCYTLITAPENFTISVYFMSVSPVFWTEKVYLEIFDGNVTSAPLLTKIEREYTENYPLFSSDRYMLFHNHLIDTDIITFDLNYVTSNKGRGCGGKLNNELGRITSPLYPDTYRKISTCEWELETPGGTHLFLRFTVFDLGKLCDQNYVSLIDRNGETISTYCSEIPADYISLDNYVKVSFTTTMNNGGTGWVADFVGTL